MKEALINLRLHQFLPCLVHAESLSYIHLPPTLLSVPLSKIRLKLSLYETALVLFLSLDESHSIQSVTNLHSPCPNQPNVTGLFGEMKCS